MVGILIATLVALLSSQSLHAADRSCLPDHTSAQILWQPTSLHSDELVRNLSSRHGPEAFLTNVQVWAEINQGQLTVTFRFDPAFDGVSLPYNLYSVLITNQNEVLGWWDFTYSCQGPGLSFFPGQEISLRPVKITGELPRLQIFVWGKL